MLQYYSINQSWYCDFLTKSKNISEKIRQIWKASSYQWLRSFPSRASCVVIDVVTTPILIKPHLPTGRKGLFGHGRGRPIVRGPPAGSFNYFTRPTCRWWWGSPEKYRSNKKISKRFWLYTLAQHLRFFSLQILSFSNSGEPKYRISLVFKWLKSVRSFIDRVPYFHY